MNLFIIICIILICSPSAFAWHTTPDRWKEPRIFHTPFEKAFEGRIVLKKVKNKTVKTEEANKKFSPNGAYWYVSLQDDLEGKRNIDLFVFNERDYLLRLSIKDIAKNYDPTIYWVNEKLLYIQIWWGRILGSYFIFDVEGERIILKEMVNEGTAVFFQFKQGEADRTKEITK